MKQITKNTILKQGDETYQPIEVDGVIYWVNKDGVKEWSDWSYNPNTPTPRQVFYRVTEYFMPHGDKVVAQSQPKLKGIPVISLWETCWNKNANQYTQKDIHRAIVLARAGVLEYDGYYFNNEMEQIFQQINSISVIEINQQFNIISYE